jgi:hypothetical protein
MHLLPQLPVWNKAPDCQAQAAGEDPARNHDPCGQEDSMAIIMALSGALAFMGALWICICFAAWDHGLTVKEWLEICDQHSKREGQILKKEYLKG